MPAPKKSVDEALIVDLAKIHCTDAEIAAMVHVSTKTLVRRYRDLIDDARQEGKASLRRLQWEAAEKGDKTMLIWLGKQQLGQRDRPDDSSNETATRDIDSFLKAVKPAGEIIADLYADDEDVDLEVDEDSE